MYYAIETTYDNGTIDVTEQFETYEAAAKYFHNECSIAHCRIVKVEDLEDLTIEQINAIQDTLVKAFE